MTGIHVRAVLKMSIHQISWFSHTQFTKAERLQMHSLQIKWRFENAYLLKRTYLITWCFCLITRSTLHSGVFGWICSVGAQATAHVNNTELFIHSQFLPSLQRGESLRSCRVFEPTTEGCLRFAPAALPATFLMRENCYIFSGKWLLRLLWLLRLAQSEAKIRMTISLIGAYDLIWFRTVINVIIRWQWVVLKFYPSYSVLESTSSIFTQKRKPEHSSSVACSIYIQIIRCQ